MAGSKKGRRYPLVACPKCGGKFGSNTLPQHTKTCPDEPLAQEAHKQGRDKRDAAADATRERRRFEHWARECSTYVSTHPNLRRLGDILAPDDPYDLQEAMRDAFSRGELAYAFVTRIFAEDIAREQGEAEEERESMEHQLAEDE